MCLYIFTMILVMVVYRKDKLFPVWALILLSFSKRIHSIYVLRLFNDSWAILFLFLSIYMFIEDRWSWGCLFFSFGVSVKMNILLFAPGLLLLLFKRFGFIGTIPKLIICLVPQIVLPIQFLFVNPWAYIQRSFDIGRQFLYIWTVNWKFINEDLFLDPIWGFILLTFCLYFWSYFWIYKWTNNETSFFSILKGKYSTKKINANHIILVMFTSNFIGVMFARSLHFQFYVWYFFTLPYLLWNTFYPNIIKIFIMLVIEIIWNIYPSNPLTSLILFICHLSILTGLILTPLKATYKSNS